MNTVTPFESLMDEAMFSLVTTIIIGMGITIIIEYILFRNYCNEKTIEQRKTNVRLQQNINNFTSEYWNNIEKIEQDMYYLTLENNDIEERLEEKIVNTKQYYIDYLSVLTDILNDKIQKLNTSHASMESHLMELIENKESSIKRDELYGIRSEIASINSDISNILQYQSIKTTEDTPDNKKIVEYFPLVLTCNILKDIKGVKNV